jgi:hypothetical protein
VFLRKPICTDSNDWVPHEAKKCSDPSLCKTGRTRGIIMQSIPHKISGPASNKNIDFCMWQVGVCVLMKASVMCIHVKPRTPMPYLLLYSIHLWLWIRQNLTGFSIWIFISTLFVIDCNLINGSICRGLKANCSPSYGLAARRIIS